MRLCSLGEKGVLVGGRKSREIWVRNKSRLSTSGQQFFRTVYDGAIAVFAGDGFWARYLDKILFLNVFYSIFRELSTRQSVVLPSFGSVDKLLEERHNPDTHGAYYIINSFSIFIYIK